MKKVQPFVFLIVSNLMFAQVGINTTNPLATLDIVSKDNSSTTKALKISNSTPSEILTIQNNGNMGINSASSTNNTAQLNVDSGAATKSVLKLTNISNTKGKTVSDINYNSFSGLSVDTNGNVFAQYDIRTINSNAITFDGTYSANTSLQTLIPLNGGSIVQFQLLTDFVLGNTTSGGSVLYADITWSRHGGFVVSTYGTEASSGTNDLTLTINNAVPSNSIGTQTLTFDFATGIDLVLSATLNGNSGAGVSIGDMQYKINSGTSVPINIATSFRSR